MDWISKARAAWHIRKSPWRIPLGDLPGELETIWRDGAPHEYQGIRTDAFFFVRAAEGLMAFFDATARSHGPCALPSEAADSVWHAWLRWDAPGLERFCRRHFGAAVPHLARAGLGEGALLNTFAGCVRLEGGAAGRLRLPRLFALDARLRMPGGHGYRLRGGDVLYAGLGPHGRPDGAPGPHPELTARALYEAGLIDKGTLLASLERRRARGRAPTAAAASGGGSGCGGIGDAGAATLAGDGGCGDGGDSSDSGGGDSGSDAGCSCGSSCGSSCGGGCGGD